jgi:hypothetical protein
MLGGEIMGWLQAPITSTAKGWQIILKVIITTAISFIVGVEIGISNINIILQLTAGIIIILVVLGLWFFFTRVLSV